MIDIATGFNIDPAHSLNHAKDDERVQIGRQAAEQGACGEDEKADDEGPAAPESVCSRAREHEQAGENQGVGVYRPLQTRERRVERPSDRGESDVDDGDVEAHDEKAHPSR